MNCTSDQKPFRSICIPKNATICGTGWCEAPYGCYRRYCTEFSDLRFGFAIATAVIVLLGGCFRAWIWFRGRPNRPAETAFDHAEVERAVARTKPVRPADGITVL